MINSKAFKKLAALTAAIALVGSFAVSASAASVTTSTAYVAGDETKVTVNVTVSDVTAGNHVTYYASNAKGVFHMDQETATGTSVTFSQYVTPATNLDAAVIVNDGTAADNTKDVTANTITINDAEVAVLPTAETDYLGTVTITADEGYAIDTTDVTVVAGADSATISPTNEANVYTVSINDIDGDVEITVGQDETDVAPETTGSWIASGYALNEDGNRQITVIGKVSDLATGKTCGITINGTPYKSETFAATEGEHAEYFVVQYVDDTAEHTYLPDGTYETGIYYETADGTKNENGSSVEVQ